MNEFQFRLPLEFVYLIQHLYIQTLFWSLLSSDYFPSLNIDVAGFVTKLKATIHEVIFAVTWSVKFLEPSQIGGGGGPFWESLAMWNSGFG